MVDFIFTPSTSDQPSRQPLSLLLQTMLSVPICISTGYQQVMKETSTLHNVFYEKKTVCNRGTARYQYDLAGSKRFPVSHEFAASVCSLPSNYSTSRYMWFLERWGTVSNEVQDQGRQKDKRAGGGGSNISWVNIQNFCALTTTVLLLGTILNFQISVCGVLLYPRRSINFRAFFSEYFHTTVFYSIFYRELERHF